MVTHASNTANLSAEQRCIHDLLLITCIWCAPRPGVDLTIAEAMQEPEPRTVEPAVNWVEASRSGTCAHCDAEIRPGTLVRLIGRKTVCKDCADADI
jgi:hypothetical protein